MFFDTKCLIFTQTQMETKRNKTALLLCDVTKGTDNSSIERCLVSPSLPKHLECLKKLEI